MITWRCANAMGFSFVTNVGGYIITWRCANAMGFSFVTKHHFARKDAEAGEIIHIIE